MVGYKIRVFLSVPHSITTQLVPEPQFEFYIIFTIRHSTTHLLHTVLRPLNLLHLLSNRKPEAKKRALFIISSDDGERPTPLQWSHASNVE